MSDYQETVTGTRAIAIATGKVQPDPEQLGTNIIGAKKDLNCQGKGPEWYRLVYRLGEWRYVSDERLPSGNFRASDRRAEVRGVVYPGEIVAQHPRGGRVDEMFLVEDDGGLRGLAWAVRRDGALCCTMTNGEFVVVPDPRKR